MPNGTVLVVLALGAIGYFYIGKPVAHGVKKTAVVISQPFRHPKKDVKVIGKHVFHFVKGNR